MTDDIATLLFECTKALTRKTLQPGLRLRHAEPAVPQASFSSPTKLAMVT